jgi:hypothetical protein
MKVKAVTMQPIRGTVAEYLAALKSSSTFGPQVVAHRVTAPREAVTLPP